MRSRILAALIAALLIVSFAGCRTAPRNADGTKMTKAERRAAAREAKEQAREEKRAKAESKRESRDERQAAATPPPPPPPAPKPMAPPPPPATSVSKTNVIALHFDRGVNASMSPQQVRAQNQLADWMERDLRNMLTKQGYVIDDKAPTALNIRITDYNPGSTAARVWVGYGAGAASLNIRYDVVQHGRLVKGEDIGVGSSQSWQKCARKLNTDTVSSMNGVLK